MVNLKFWEKGENPDVDAVAEDRAPEEPKNVPLDDNERKAQSLHYGDPGYNEYLDEDNDDIEADLERTTWKEVCTSCWCHSRKEWGRICLLWTGILVCLYFFIFSLELLGTGAKVLTGCAAAALFGDNTNPVAALIVGMLVTVLLQSSSTTTSIIVSLVGSGAISVEAGIYMVMGANIGTSVTNTIVAMGQMGDGEELERAFAGATVHDMFNFLSVLVLFPIECITHMLARLTAALTKNYTPNEDGGQKTKGIKAIIAPLLDLLIKANKKVIDEVANNVKTCADYYPTDCNPDGTVTYEACVKNGRVGLITCSKDTNICPAFFREGATEKEDKVSGGAALFLGIVFLVICLVGLVTILKKLLFGASTRIIRKATDINGYLSMLIGCGVTVLVQSSSVTTSVLTPLVGVGLITVEQMYPLTLGANLGTTITGILAAVVSSTSDAMQVALAHFFFNVFGILIWYPLPFMRRVPINMAKALGTGTKWWRGFPILYIAVIFFLVPLLLLGISALFTGAGKGNKAFGAIITIALGLLLIKFLWWWRCQEGKDKTRTCFQARQNRREVMNAIPLEWNPLKKDVKRLKVYTGLPDEEDDDDEQGEDGDVEEVDDKPAVNKDIDQEEIDEDYSDVEVVDDKPAELTSSQLRSNEASFTA